MTIYRLWTLQAVHLPGDALRQAPPVESMVATDKRFTVQLVQVGDVDYVTIKNNKSGFSTHVPMANVRCFELLTKEYEEALTSPKGAGGISRGLVSRLVG